MNQISLVIPSHNNLRHIKNAYASIKKHAPYAEIIMIDDASTDGTYDWLKEKLKEDDNLIIFRVEDRLGHTILYDYGIDAAKNEVVGIMHADMIMGPNYLQNVMKHLQKGVVVCGTRIEPPLHPPGNEKIIMNFGMDFDDLNVPAFEAYALEKQREFKDQTTKGMFAPWMIHKSDFVSMGGHDAVFAPFPYEDSDIFQRWILSGYELVQSRDAFVYHLTCRGHRWTEKIQKDDDYYKEVSNRAARNYLRKWGSWIKNDEYQHPVIRSKYDIGFSIKDCTLQILDFIEPWGTCVYIEDQSMIDSYIALKKGETALNMERRVKNQNSNKNHSVLVEFNARQFNQEAANFVQQLPEILDQVGEPGIFEYGIFTIVVNKSGGEKLDPNFVMVKNVF